LVGQGKVLDPCQSDVEERVLALLGNEGLEGALVELEHEVLIFSRFLFLQQVKGAARLFTYYLLDKNHLHQLRLFTQHRHNFRQFPIKQPVPRQVHSMKLRQCTLTVLPNIFN
jgi:hypothetical protein